jgi:hypothetical protein
MHPYIVYGFVIFSQIALAVFKVLEIKWVVENNITKSVILFNIQTLFWIASTAWSVDSFLKGDWVTIMKKHENPEEMKLEIKNKL